MKKTSLIISGVTVALVTLTGCGGGSSSVTQEDITTGTGYYVDSAVRGITYTCGSKIGVTDANGKFIFEKGKDCAFNIGNITLRTVKADYLVDNAKVIEDNTTVARFLQSIDTDGESSNGIEISDKVLTILTNIFTSENIKEVPKDTELDTVVSKIQQEDTTFQGYVKTVQEVENHLLQTKESIFQELIVGKTLYYVQNDDFGHEEQAGFNLAKIEFKNDGTMIWTEINTIDAGQPYTTQYRFENSHLFLFSGEEEGSGEYNFVQQNNDYIEISEISENNNPTYLFSDEQKAKDFVKAKNTAQ